MKIETVKSFVLAILVGVSLLLTLGLWSFQPNYKYLDNMDYAEADIGGEDNVSKKDIVEPKSIIFHNYSRHYGFSDPKDRQKLYQDMQSWVLFNFETSKANGPPDDDYQVEMVFPDELPMAMVDKLFTLNEEAVLPDWSFQRVYITFDTHDSSLKIQFLSMNGDQKASAIVNNSQKYDLLWTYVINQRGLSEYIPFDKSDSPIYIPKQPQGMNQLKLTVTEIDPDKLVDALFSNPQIVRRNISNVGEVYYSDTIRGMRVQGKGRSIAYFNPLNTNYERMSPMDLLDISMKNINEHNGWTGDYNLEELRPSTNFVRYRMYYDGYPTFNHKLSVIEQEWRNQDLYKYQRPLFSLNGPPGNSSVDLQSGNDVIYLLKNSDYNLDNIEDIRLGYHVVYDDSDLSYYLTLKPAWHMKYNGNWQEIRFDDSPQHKGGS